MFNKANHTKHEESPTWTDMVSKSYKVKNTPLLFFFQFIRLCMNQLAEEEHICSLCCYCNMLQHLVKSETFY